jgi:CheY-like chemotaxis protein
MQTEMILMNNSNGPPVHTRAPRENVKRIRAKALRVLLVDDTPGYRKSVAMKLKNIYGVSVEEADSGEGCLERMRHDLKIDLILLDLMMQDMSGLDTYKALKAMGPSCAIALMSAYPDSDLWRDAKELGVPMLHKPIPDEYLEDVLLSC